MPAKHQPPSSGSLYPITYNVVLLWVYWLGLANLTAIRSFLVADTRLYTIRSIGLLVRWSIRRPSVRKSLRNIIDYEILYLSLTFSVSLVCVRLLHHTHLLSHLAGLLGSGPEGNKDL